MAAPGGQQQRIGLALKQLAARSPGPLKYGYVKPRHGGGFIDPRVSGEIGLATTGLTTAAELALGQIPFTAPLAIGLAISELFGFDPLSVFSGRPKMLDTVQAVARLYQSRDPEVQQLARNLSILVKNGAPLSSGEPRIQAQIRDWIGGAVRTILDRYGLTNNPNAVGQLDTAIRRVLTSEVATGGHTVDNVIAQLAQTPRAPMPSLSLPRRTPLRNPATSLPAPPAPAAQPPEQGIIAQLESLARTHPLLNLGVCLGLYYSGQEGLFLRCIEGLLAAQIEPEVRSIITNTRNYFSRLFNRQPIAPPPLPAPQPQPYTAPLPQPYQPPPPPTDVHPMSELNPQGTDWARPCPACDRIARQRGEIQEEIQTETQQDLTSELDRIQRQIDQLGQLEQRPAESRNITQELAQKRQLLNQLDQLQQEATGQPAQTFPRVQPGEPPPLPQPTGHVELVCPPGTHQCHTDTECEQYGDCVPDSVQPAQQGGHDDTHEKIQFCVGCNSQEDAILFLNGEPSQCSVIPGSTKPI